MVKVIPQTKEIRMYGGDTGSISVRPKGYSFESADRALFTVKNHKKEEVMSRLLPIENGVVTIRFEHGDTKDLPAGEYKWDLRFYIQPQYDQQEKLIGGEEVETPGSPYILTIKDTVGKA